MRRIVPFALLGLLALAAHARAGCLLGGCLHGGCCPPCTPIPCQECPDCGCPCEQHRLHLNFLDRSEDYIETLRCIGCTGPAGCATGACGDSGSNCCERIHAAEMLGCRLHADFCCNPEVLTALIAALQCDPCWEVRKAAAWSIAMQGARTDQGVLALYIASKTDPHSMVRTRSAEALDVLTVCRAACFKDLYKHGDDIIKQLKAKGYKPGTANCRVLFAEACAACGLPMAEPIAAPPMPTVKPGPEAFLRQLPMGR
jgi:hypothetical protein